MAVTEERLERIGYLEPWIFEYASRDIFSEDVWHTRQALMKWHIKVPKANSRWYVEYVQLVKTDVEFHCSRTLSRDWRCSWTSAGRWCSNYIWVINNLIAYHGPSYMGGFTVNGLSDIRAWIRNYIHSLCFDLITNPCSEFHTSLAHFW